MDSDTKEICYPKSLGEKKTVILPQSQNMSLCGTFWICGYYCLQTHHGFPLPGWSILEAFQKVSKSRGGSWSKDKDQAEGKTRGSCRALCKLQKCKEDGTYYICNYNYMHIIYAIFFTFVGRKTNILTILNL